VRLFAETDGVPTLLRPYPVIGQGSIPSRQAGRQRETRHRITIQHKFVLGVVLVIEHGKIDLCRELDRFLMMASTC